MELTKHTKSDNIAFIIAMLDEAKPIIELLNLNEVEKKTLNIVSKLPIKIFQNKIDEKNIYLFTNGFCKNNHIDRVGTEAAALTTTLVLEHIKPELIISAGTCGADHNNFTIGDVIIGIDKYIYHNRIIPLDDFDKYGFGMTPVWSQSKAIANKLNLKTAKIATSNSLLMTKEDKRIFKQYDISIKEMEVASIAEVASYYDTDVLAIKAVTDYYNKDNTNSAEQFLANFNLATENLKNTVGSLLKIL